MKSYCLPYMLYASEAIPLSVTNIHVLDNCINRETYKNFGVQDVQYSIAFLEEFSGIIKFISFS